MQKLRNTLTIGVVVVAAIGAVAGVYVVNQVSEEAARSLVAVEAGVVVALAVVVWVLLGPTVKRLDELIEALRALARGDKHQRVDAALFAGFGDVARAVNEVAASLCENDDPNLGPVQKRTREAPQQTHKVKKQRTDPPSDKGGSEKEPSTKVPRADATASANVSEHPEIGQVRVRKKEPKEPAPPTTTTTTTEPAPKPLIGGEEVSEPRPRKKVVEETPAPATEKAPEAKPEPATAPKPEPKTEPAPAVEEKAAAAAEEEEEDDDGGNDTVIEAAEPQLPSRLELQQLFSEFVKEKKAAGHDDVDVDFDAFQETILGECERLLQEHGCKGVRFEVAVGEGEVSLRPRLLR